MKVLAVKTNKGHLAPFDDESLALFQKLKQGQAVKVEVKRVRNLAFHRKAFALFKLAFELWRPEQTGDYKGVPISRNFEQFRKDITILAGFYTPVYGVDGSVRLVPDSLSFDNMPEERFYEVYRGVLTVIWEKIMRQAGYLSESEVDAAVQRLLEFE